MSNSSSPSASTSTSSSYFVRVRGSALAVASSSSVEAARSLLTGSRTRFRIPRPFARPPGRNQARPGARLGWTPRESEHAAFSVASRMALSENVGPSCARFSVRLFPHRDKGRFVTTLSRGTVLVPSSRHRLRADVFRHVGDLDKEHVAVVAGDVRGEDILSRVHSDARPSRRVKHRVDDEHARDPVCPQRS